MTEGGVADTALAALMEEGSIEEKVLTLRITGNAIVVWATTGRGMSHSATIVGFLTAIKELMLVYCNDENFAVAVHTFFFHFLGTSCAALFRDQIWDLVKTGTSQVDDTRASEYGPVVAAMIADKDLTPEFSDLVVACGLIAHHYAEKMTAYVVDALVRRLNGGFGEVNRWEMVDMVSACLSTCTKEKGEVIFTLIVHVLLDIAGSDREQLADEEEGERSRIFADIVDYLGENCTRKNLDNFGLLIETGPFVGLLALLMERHAECIVNVHALAKFALASVEWCVEAFFYSSVLLTMNRIGRVIHGSCEDESVKLWFDLVEVLVKVLPDPVDALEVLVDDTSVFEWCVCTKTIVEHFEYIHNFARHLDNMSMVLSTVMRAIMTTLPVDDLQSLIVKNTTFRDLLIAAALQPREWKLAGQIAGLTIDDDVYTEVIERLLVMERLFTVMLSGAGKKTGNIEKIIRISFDKCAIWDLANYATVISTAFEILPQLLEVETFGRILECLKDSGEDILGTILLDHKVFDSPALETAVNALERFDSVNGKETITRFIYAHQTREEERENEEVMRDINYRKWSAFRPDWDTLMTLMIDNPVNTCLHTIAETFATEEPQVARESVRGLFAIDGARSLDIIFKMIVAGWTFGEFAADILCHCINHCGIVKAWSCAISIIFGTVIDTEAEDWCPENAAANVELNGFVDKFFLMAAILLPRASILEKIADFFLRVIDTTCSTRVEDDDILSGFSSLFGVIDASTTRATKIMVQPNVCNDEFGLTLHPIFPYNTHNIELRNGGRTKESGIPYGVFVEGKSAAIGRRDPHFTNVIERLTNTLIKCCISVCKRDSASAHAAVRDIMTLVVQRNPYISDEVGGSVIMCQFVRGFAVMSKEDPMTEAMKLLISVVTAFVSDCIHAGVMLNELCGVMDLVVRMSIARDGVVPLEIGRALVLVMTQLKDTIRPGDRSKNACKVGLLELLIECGEAICANMSGEMLSVILCAVVGFCNSDRSNETRANLIINAMTKAVDRAKFSKQSGLHDLTKKWLGHMQTTKEIMFDQQVSIQVKDKVLNSQDGLRSVRASRELETGRGMKLVATASQHGHRVLSAVHVFNAVCYAQFTGQRVNMERVQRFNEYLFDRHREKANPFPEHITYTSYEERPDLRTWQLLFVWDLARLDVRREHTLTSDSNDTPLECLLFERKTGECILLAGVNGALEKQGFDEAIEWLRKDSRKYTTFQGIPVISVLE